MGSYTHTAYVHHWSMAFSWFLCCPHSSVCHMGHDLQPCKDLAWRWLTCSCLWLETEEKAFLDAIIKKQDNSEPGLLLLWTKDRRSEIMSRRISLLYQANNFHVSNSDELDTLGKKGLMKCAPHPPMLGRWKIAYIKICSYRLEKIRRWKKQGLEA